MNDYPVTVNDFYWHNQERKNAKLYAAYCAMRAADQAAAEALALAADALAQHYTSQEEDATVLLGNKNIADTQKILDDSRGSLAARVCGYGR